LNPNWAKPVEKQKEPPPGTVALNRAFTQREKFTHTDKSGKEQNKK
jgi:hypothetical protein